MRERGFNLPQRTAGSLNRLADYVAAYNHFHATVLLPPCRVVIRCDRTVLTQAKSLNVGGMNQPRPPAEPGNRCSLG